MVSTGVRRLNQFSHRASQGYPAIAGPVKGPEFRNFRNFFSLRLGMRFCQLRISARIAESESGIRFHRLVGPGSPTRRAAESASLDP